MTRVAPEPAPRLLFDGSGGDDLVVVRSSFWHYNAIGFHAGEEACVIDPGIYPQDMELLQQQLATVERRDSLASARRVTHVLLTHSHHDHIRGWMRFPQATIVAPRVVIEKEEGPRSRILATKRLIDERLGIEDPDFRYPEVDIVFDQHLRIEIAGRAVELIALPGHSNCCSMVWIPHLSTLCTADYLVSPGLPYCRWEARPFEVAIERLQSFVLEHDVQRIMPAHNEALIGTQDILAALEEERSYFSDLRAEVRRGLSAGTQPEALRSQAGRFMSQRRNRRQNIDVGKRERQDLDNAGRVIQEETK